MVEYHRGRGATGWSSVARQGLRLVAELGCNAIGQNLNRVTGYD
jgi:hypothetical protein